MLIIGHQALVVIGRKSRIGDSNSAKRVTTTGNAVRSGSIERRLKISEFPEYDCLWSRKEINAPIALILIESGGPRNLIVRAISRRVGLRQQRQQVRRGWTDPVRANHIEDAVAGDLCSSSPVRVAGRRVVDRVDGCDGTEISRSESIDRHRFIARCEEIIPHPLIVTEEKDLVMNNRTADAAAKLIPAIAGNAIGLAEVIGCVEPRGAVVLEKRPMKSIRARLSRDLPKPTGHLPILGVVVAGGEFHFLHRVIRSHNDR